MPLDLSNDLAFIAAPMVNQSDMPFRLLVRRYGATSAYTQMYLPERLLTDKEYLDYHIRDLTLAKDVDISRPVIAQICDLNLGCPQEAARDGHFGAYLLGQKDWPLVQNIVASMSRSFTVPVSTKFRLCQPSTKTLEFAQMLEGSGASWVTLHARTVSARRRRQGAADLSEVKRLKDNLQIPVISNGNVRSFDNLQENLALTGADGLMVGLILVRSYQSFKHTYGISWNSSGEDLSEMQKAYFITYSASDCFSGRRPWFPKFRAALGATLSLDEIEVLMNRKVERWRGRPPRPSHQEVTDDLPEANNDHESSVADDELGVAFPDELSLP
ncbi:hypothetical protein CVT26_003859 [Gymnopilus dilepis]|uniref:DUS-like FMN-binding domain-containing protein n=1 Tax=Gymnopilus dilepis TaxID=231916 RepID=A0A409YV32_9AGAR|nr:hypothetical protein CVT26_003859 [Gymnopilus dilepis]